MTTITNFSATTVDEKSVPADAHGNNVAFKCTECGEPVLAVLRDHQRGSSAEKPATCRCCSTSYWLQAVVEENRLIVHRVPNEHSGRYALGRKPNPTTSANAASWSVISATLHAYGSADYEDLCSAVRQHAHPAGGRTFVDYCIANGWLQRT